MNYLEIPLFRLLGSVGLIALAMALSQVQRLGLVWDLGVGAVRAAVQLIAIGYALVLLFQGDHALVVAAALLLMLVVAALTASRRVAKGARTRDLFPAALVSIGIAGLLAVAPVLLWIVRVRPVLDARYAIPISGMMLASAMNVVAQVFERMLTGAKQQTALLEQALALGASPVQALAPLRRAALRAALIPAINALLTVGLVQLPGMMTGQILSGTSPIQAVRYQLVIMYQLVAVAAIAGTLASLLLQRVLFDDAGRMRRQGGA